MAWGTRILPGCKVLSKLINYRRIVAIVGIMIVFRSDYLVLEARSSTYLYQSKKEEGLFILS